MTSLLVTSLLVTSLSLTSHPEAMLLSVMSNGTFCTTTIVKERRGCTSGHAQNILPVMTSLPVTWFHVASFPVRAASGDVTSSNACRMASSPLLPPNYSIYVRSKPGIDGPGCVPFKIVSDSSTLHSRWLLFFKVMIISLWNLGGHICWWNGTKWRNFKEDLT
jgi:hypothetical protein